MDSTVTTVKDSQLLQYLKDVLDNMPNDWLRLTTHRLDIYNEAQAKFEFLEHFEKLYNDNNTSADALKELPTAFDYIRLGHPLSCILEWAMANLNDLKPQNVISFSSETTPVLAVLRKNLLDKKATRIAYTDSLPENFDPKVVKHVYGYNFELKQINNTDELSNFEGTTVLITPLNKFGKIDLPENVDFYVGIHDELGSVILTKGDRNEAYISEIQHVRRRESIAMTPINSLLALNLLIGKEALKQAYDFQTDRSKVQKSIKEITVAATDAVVGSSGLSIQYAIMMGLVDYALENYPGKDIKFIVPPNCYGGTNDQARRVAACLDNVEVMDLPVDGDHNMVESTDLVLDKIAEMDAVPYIIAEIPTNPRVEVPEMAKLRDALSKSRKTPSGATAIDPVFILDQTFCPNVHFLGDDEMLSSVRTISYVSGSKFPSGGMCTAGYCVANKKAKDLMPKIDLHLKLCDNEATPLQMELLAKQMPSMNERIAGAYKNTRAFVNFIKETLPEAKINFVSEELAAEGFTPSVFSLDLPTKGDSDQQREDYKRALNNKLINMMIREIPNDSKYCVSYGQLKGCYWTIPATSTQGTTKEGDKDYIVRVSLSPEMDLEHHKQVFSAFVDSI